MNTAQEISGKISRSNANSAMGQDGLSYEMLKHIMDANQDILTDLFNNVLRYGIFPIAWKHAKCIPIPNPGRANLPTSKNLLPISLVSCLGKTFENNLT